MAVPAPFVYIDGDGARKTGNAPLAPGRALAAESRPVALSNEDFAAIDNIETLLTTIDGHVDGLETAVAATNTALATTNSNLTTIDGRVDGLETLITATNTALGTLNTAVASTTPSPVELGPFSAVYLTSGTNAAVQTATAAAGDYLQHVTLQPTTTSPGAFTLYDGSTSGTNSIKYTHPGGASSLSNLAPITLGFTANCVNAGWHITIVSGWTVTLVGRFS